VTSFI